MALEPEPTRWWNNERVLNRVTTGVLLLLLFLILGFEDGWARAALQCLVFIFCLSFMTLVVSLWSATSLQDIREDKSTQVVAVFTLLLGLAAYMLAGRRAVLYMSMFGVMIGSIIGGMLRFSVSSVGRSIGRSERRLIGRVRKKLRRRQ